jgi:hypothetical protein
VQNVQCKPTPRAETKNALVGKRDGFTEGMMPKHIEEVEREESSNTPILIKTYGEFWNPEMVNWKNSWRLLGKRTRKGIDINVYEERGVYVLYSDYSPVYVGKAFDSSIGYRLQGHRQSVRKGPRWDRFSWFGVLGLNSRDRLHKSKHGLRVTPEELVATLEALLIVAIDPRLNARKEKFKNAVRLLQSDSDKSPEVEERLDAIDQKLEALLQLRGSK